MTRVAVIGNAGGGKSTICRKLSAKTGLPCFAIDKIMWKPGWERVSDQEFDHEHQRLIEKQRWIIDGFGSWESVERRFHACDTIIYVDHPIWQHYWWATKRQFMSIFVGRPDGPEGCPMLPVTFKLFKMMWWIHREMRPKMLESIAAYSSSKRIIHIRSPKQLATFAANPV